MGGGTGKLNMMDNELSKQDKFCRQKILQQMPVEQIRS